jgi:RNA polymerase sigma-70 factor (ECF subfamily)
VIDPAARGAWKALEDRLRPFVARRVRREDVDDVVQDIFLRMLRGLPGLREEERFGPWVYQVARSAIADQSRAAARHPVATGEPPEQAAPGLTAAGEREEDAAARALATQVAPFVAMLPSPYREALALTELEGMSQVEAARMLGISVSGMKSRVQRGRRQLRQLFEDCCHIALDARGRVVDCEPRRDGRLPACECGR